MPVASASTHVTRAPRKKRRPRPALIVASVRGGPGAERPDEVDEVPDVRVADAALDAFHLELRAGAVGDHRKDFTVGRTANPRGVREVGRLHALRRQPAVAAPQRPVAELAVL